MRRSVLFIVLSLVITAGLFFAWGFPENPELAEFEVRNASMTGIFDPGENIEVDFGYYENNVIKRGDIVLFSYAGRENYLVKTVYGIPDDIVGLEKVNGEFRLLINGRPAVNSEGAEFSFNSQKAQLLSLYVADYRGRIPADAYLLLGNLEGGSLDSSQFGFVSSESIVGKVIR